MTTSQFQTEALDRPSCEALLARGFIGRIAFSFRDQVDIRPIAYVFDPVDGWIFGRMEAGEKVRTLLHHRWVAFQIDEVESLWSWSSVVVQGALHFLVPSAEGASMDSEFARVRGRAEEALRTLFPDLGEPSDPGAHRTLLFGIAPQEVSGRRGWLASPDSLSG
jgi:nitroimidazol reductase NimA-like FMN-containing flavoprotein (pyridoxamine 5'-phosphate oxidase superfamily)